MCVREHLSSQISVMGSLVCLWWTSWRLASSYGIKHSDVDRSFVSRVTRFWTYSWDAMPNHCVKGQLVFLESGDFTFAKSVREELLRALTEGHEGGEKKPFQLWKLGENLFFSCRGKQCENADTSGEFTGLQTSNSRLTRTESVRLNHPRASAEAGLGHPLTLLTGADRKWSRIIRSKREKTSSFSVTAHSGASWTRLLADLLTAATPALITSTERKLKSPWNHNWRFLLFIRCGISLNWFTH